MGCDDIYDERTIDGDGGCRLVVRGGAGREDVFLGVVPRDRDRDVVLRMRAALLAALSALHHGDGCPSRGTKKITPCNCGIGPVFDDIRQAMAWPPEDVWQDKEDPLIGVVLDRCMLADLHETVRLMQPSDEFRWPAKFKRFRRSTR